MPEMDGLTAYRKIVHAHPDIGCIIISAEKDTTTLRTAMSIGVQEYLIKPYTIDELETAIDELKYRKAAMESTQYRRQLQQMLLELAQVQGELDK